ncbi:hypothetical protein EDB19DRAFT_1712351 [Suillus lakei]|nr:hypothetical protein EDB19DRAFT_1712351 [Suillus lakei]
MVPHHYFALIPILVCTLTMKFFEVSSTALLCYYDMYQLHSNSKTKFDLISEVVHHINRFLMRTVGEFAARWTLW